MRNADNAENAVMADNGRNSPPGFAITDNGRAKTSARPEAATSSPLFAPGLSRVLDLPHNVHPWGMGLGKRMFLGTRTIGSSRSGVISL
jgi:hypothetical protein